MIRIDRVGHDVVWARPGRYYLVAVPIARAAGSPDGVEPDTDTVGAFPQRSVATPISVLSA